MEGFVENTRKLLVIIEYLNVHHSTKLHLKKYNELEIAKGL